MFLVDGLCSERGYRFLRRSRPSAFSAKLAALRDFFGGGKVSGKKRGVEQRLFFVFMRVLVVLHFFGLCIFSLLFFQPASSIEC
jgi:uncharacterized membrane protein YtjA (UPF0391 family)